MERKRLEECEHRPQLLADRRRAMVVEHEPHRAVLQRRLRDRGVCAHSEDALVETRDERREHLALPDRPFRRPAHHLLGELRDRVTEKLLPVAQRPHDARRVAHDQVHHREHQLVGQTMSLMDFLESHASSRASSPTRRRRSDAPRAAETMISNSSSSLYVACNRRRSSSVTLYACASTLSMSAWRSGGAPCPSNAVRRWDGAATPAPSSTRAITLLRRRACGSTAIRAMC